jgi:hypothetical protein
MNTLFKSANILNRNKTSIQFLKKSIGKFSINRYTVLRTENSRTLLQLNKKNFWKKENKDNKDDKPEKNKEEKVDEQEDDKPAKGFEKFHRKKKDDNKEDKKENKDKDPNEDDKGDEDPNKGKYIYLYRQERRRR